MKPAKKKPAPRPKKRTAVAEAAARGPCRHRAICLAFLEAHARAKEPK